LLQAHQGAYLSSALGEQSRVLSDLGIRQNP
jgi:hypothetical protein